MKKILIIILLSTTIFAQSESQIGLIAKFGAAGGFTPVILFPNFDKLTPYNQKLSMEEFNSPLVAWGGGGYAYVMFIDNLRMGGIGFGGSQSRTSRINGVNNEFIYSLGGGGFTIEYTMPFVKNMALSAGFILGGGSLELNIYENSGSFSWDNVWSNLPENSFYSKEISIKNSFLFFSPTVNLDVPITRFLAIRGGLGYQFTFTNDWTIANDKELLNIPDGLNGNGLFIQTGILIGLFAF
ncbi:MAG: hypothetical protein CR986_07990 [Ignavibacteriae bacterium]|nr:MAG: hypothetical protein CR986_07990 [Ignavibacteriota bacterium]